MKCSIRGCCIGYACHKKKATRDTISQAQILIGKIEEQLQTGSNNHISKDEINKLAEELAKAKTKLDDLIYDEVKGAAMRSRTIWYEEGDKASKMFLNLERAQAERKCIKKLRTEDGKLLTNTKDIMAEQQSYYQRLYTSKQDPNQSDEVQELEAEILHLDSPKIDPSELEDLTRRITEEEIGKIIGNSPKDKSPGSDGLTNEFYQAFWPMVKKHLLAAYNEYLEEGELGISQKRGIISLIPKANKDPEYLKNWRPITLLNQDYKYLAKCLSERCKKVLPSIIHSDQNGFVPGRVIGTNIHRALNLIEHCKDQNINGVLVNIDYEKAFDSVEWTLIYKALKYFGFPDKFIKWVRILYTNIESGILNNGHLSKFFKPSRGVRQGCPLSPSLFVITIELLAVYIRHQITIKGITSMNGNSYIISQFADDTSFAILNHPGNLDDLFKILDRFTSISGLKINVEKSELLLLGTGTAWDIPKEHRKLIKEEVKMLGIMISTNKQKLQHSNYDPVLEKMRNKAAIWSKRRLSLAGKIAIIKTLITSQLVYCMTVLPSPNKEYWKEVNKILFGFLANNKTEKLKRDTIIGQYKQGGFQMIDIETQNRTIKIGWVKRLATDNGVWSSYIINKLPKVTLEYLLRCNIKYTDLSLDLPQYSIWSEILQKWCDLNYEHNIAGKEMVYNQNIWLNSHIKIGKKGTLNQRWYNKGIRWLKDLVHTPHERNQNANPGKTGIKI